MRLYESAITSRSVFLRKICGPATFEFCNKIGQQRTHAVRLEDCDAIVSVIESVAPLAQ
jgi:hypothetical protein